MSSENKNEPDAFHLGVKALVFNREGQLLLLKRDHPVKKLYWDLPGGRLNKGESIMETLSREVAEETGLVDLGEVQPFATVVTDIRIPLRGRSNEESVGLIFSIFSCHLSKPFQLVLSGEHVSFEWLTAQEASLKLKSRYPAELIEKLKNYRIGSR